MKELSKKEVFDLFEIQIRKSYKKSGSFIWRFPNDCCETILTIVSGKLETIKVARADRDVILRNIEIGSSAEIYTIDKEKFYQRYETNAKSFRIDGMDWDGCDAKGKAEAFCYHGETIRFMAPWDEEMLCEDGDYIARPIPGKPEDIYRIEKETFNQTYKELV
jgi:hypothetical protein